MYGSNAACAAYHLARGNAVWGAATSEVQDQARQRGSDYVDRAYRNRLPGVRTGGAAQLEEWPRTGASYRTGEAIDPASVPIQVEYAAYEAALREMVKPGSLLPDFSEDNRITEKTAGSVTIRYQSQIRSGGTSAPLNRAAVPYELAAGESRSIPFLSGIDALLSGILRPALLPGAITV